MPFNAIHEYDANSAPNNVDIGGANIAEGCGRGSYPDNRRHVRIARGSLYELQHWLRGAFRRNLMTSAQVKRISECLDVLLPKLNAYLKSIGPKSS